jgi:phosphoglycolate phosphatase
MTKKLVIFDFDGTIIDFKSVAAASLADFSNYRGLPYDVEKMLVGYVDLHKNDVGWGVPLDEQESLFQEMGAYLTEQIVKYKKFVPQLFAHAKDIIHALSENYDLSIVSARDRASLLTIMEDQGIRDYFTVYRSACCAREKNIRIKPEPDTIHCLLSESGHDFDDVIVIGDTTADIRMARNAGVKSIAVTWGLHPRDLLQTSEPDYLLDDIRALPDVIQGAFSR